MSFNRPDYDLFIIIILHVESQKKLSNLSQSLSISTVEESTLPVPKEPTNSTVQAPKEPEKSTPQAPKASENSTTPIIEEKANSLDSQPTPTPTPLKGKELFLKIKLIIIYFIRS